MGSSRPAPVGRRPQTGRLLDGDGDVRTVEPAADDDRLDPAADPLFTLLAAVRARPARGPAGPAA